MIPWTRQLALIAPHYPKAGHGTQPMPLARMLRIYFLQHWFNLSDPAMEDALYDSEAMRRFAGDRAAVRQATLAHALRGVVKRMAPA